MVFKPLTNAGLKHLCDCKACYYYLKVNRATQAQ